MGSAGGVTPGPSQWKSGVPVTPVGRVTEQVRVTVSPVMTEEEGEEVREIMAGSVEKLISDFLCKDSIFILNIILWNMPELLITGLIYSICSL